MPESDLTNYIKQQLQAGSSADQLRSELLAIGWTTEQINQAWPQPLSQEQEQPASIVRPETTDKKLICSEIPNTAPAKRSRRVGWWLSLSLLLLILFGGVIYYQPSLLVKIKAWGGELGEEMSNNWRKFLGQKPADQPPTQPNGITNNLSEAEVSELKNQIKQELEKEMKQELQRLAQEAGSDPNTGIMVMPSSGDMKQDEIRRKYLQNLANLFSDKVEVSLDEEGESGKITPIFKDKRGDDYIFVLTPINQQNNHASTSQ